MPTTVKEVIEMLRLKLTSEQIRACRYLERRGLEFCVDFGHQNAVEKARGDWLSRRRALANKRRAK